MPTLQLRKGQIDLWLATGLDGDGFVETRKIESWLSPVERSDLERFVTPTLRRDYLIARALVRGVLSRYANLRPEDWTFKKNSHGKPSVTGGSEVGELCFNLSHTRGLMALAVTTGCELGVDVELIAPERATLEVAEDFFSKSETQALRRQEEGSRGDYFFRLWTLKESYIKARGLGLAIPLDAFSFQLTGNEVLFSAEKTLGEEPEAWRFFEYKPSSKHRLALAIRRGMDEETAIRSVKRVRSFEELMIL